MKEFTEDKNWTLFARYLGNEMSDTERVNFEQSLAGDDLLAGEFENAKSVWQHSSLKEAELFNVDQGWGKMTKRIREDNAPKIEPKRGLIYSAMRMAAGILILMSLAFLAQRFISSARFVRISAEEKMVTNPIVLPDGSKIYLNAGSTVKYPRKFGQKARNVELNGEAYFDVVHNPKMPFIIRTHTAKIKVLGTSFNVNAYHDADSVAVTVEKGLVELESVQNHDILQVAKGVTGVYYSQLNTFTKTELDINTVAWKTNFLSFNNSSLNYVVNTLSRIYNKTITLKTENLRNCQLTGNFRDQNLEKILEAIKVNYNLTITKTAKGYVLSGPGC